MLQDLPLVKISLNPLMYQFSNLLTLTSKMCHGDVKTSWLALLQKNNETWLIIHSLVSCILKGTRSYRIKSSMFFFFFLWVGLYNGVWWRLYPFSIVHSFICKSPFFWSLHYTQLYTIQLNVIRAVKLATRLELVDKETLKAVHSFTNNLYIF